MQMNRRNNTGYARYIIFGNNWQLNLKTSPKNTKQNQASISIFWSQLTELLAASILARNADGQNRRLI